MVTTCSLLAGHPGEDGGCLCEATDRDITSEL